MYGLGMSYRDISKHVEEMYGMALAPSVLKDITDRILPKVTAWRNRPLEDVYPIVWLDAMHLLQPVSIQSNIPKLLDLFQIFLATNQLDMTNQFYLQAYLLFH